MNPASFFSSSTTSTRISDDYRPEAGRESKRVRDQVGIPGTGWGSGRLANVLSPPSGGPTMTADGGSMVDGRRAVRCWFLRRMSWLLPGLTASIVVFARLATDHSLGFC